MEIFNERRTMKRPEKKEATPLTTFVGRKKIFGYNLAYDDWEAFLPNINELTEIIAKYHVELGKRMVMDKGKNAKVSPSRELAKAISKRLGK